MRYSEFEELVVSSGYEIDKHLRYLNVRDELGNALLFISLEMEFVIGTNFIMFRDLPYHEKNMLFNLATKLASTPLDEREDEQKYYVEFIEDAYLVRYPMSGNFGMAIAKEVSQGVTKFTEREIKDYDERFWAFAVPVEEVKDDE